MNAQDNIHLHSDDWQRTIYIDTLEVGATDFKIAPETRSALVEQGVRGAHTYFRWFDDPAELPLNRIGRPTFCLRGDGMVHRLQWDPDQERFTNSEWANHFLDRPRREQYSLPRIG
jgi:hypothetical protein